MREIKFRAYSTRRNEITPIIDLYFFEEEGVHDFTGEGHHDKYAFMQFTGLHDVNGVEIYEGDILEDGHEESVFIVDWQFNGWCKKRPDWEDDTLSFLLIDKHDLKSVDSGGMGYHVIGNIYENREMLNDR